MSATKVSSVVTRSVVAPPLQGAGEAVDAEAAGSQAPGVDPTPPAAPNGAVTTRTATAPLFERGQTVSVPRYGRGIVDAVDAEGIAVVFPEGSRRVFLAAFVRRHLAPGRRTARAAKVAASAA